jgi:hypothetical protein
MQRVLQESVFGLFERILTAWQEPAIFFARRKQVTHDKGVVSLSMTCVPRERLSLMIPSVPRVTADGKKKSSINCQPTM